MQNLILAVVLGLQGSVALGEDEGTQSYPEELSGVYQTNIRRLDGRVAPCNAQKIVAGDITRVGKWVVVQEVAQPAPQPAGDPYGFTAWLNSTRAQYGLPAVGHDPNLSNWAAMNNTQQASRGMGHYVLGPARRQNSAMGHVASIGAMWMGSPGHRSALLDPTIRWIGIAGLGAYWTMNAN